MSGSSIVRRRTPGRRTGLRGLSAGGGLGTVTQLPFRPKVLAATDTDTCVRLLAGLRADRVLERGASFSPAPGGFTPKPPAA